MLEKWLSIANKKAKETCETYTYSCVYALIRIDITYLLLNSPNKSNFRLACKAHRTQNIFKHFNLGTILIGKTIKM